MHNKDKKIRLEGKYENVIEINEHFYLISKKNKITVLPYTINSKGLLDKIGVIKDYNYILEEYDYTLLNGYINEDDSTNLVAANRIIYEALKINVSNAENWMYLGSLYNTLTSDSVIALYCVNLSEKNIPEVESINSESIKMEFRMVDSSQVITSDDTLLLAAYLRLFNFFYINSLSNE